MFSRKSLVDRILLFVGGKRLTSFFRCRLSSHDSSEDKQGLAPNLDSSIGSLPERTEAGDGAVEGQGSHTATNPEILSPQAQAEPAFYGEEALFLEDEGTELKVQLEDISDIVDEPINEHTLEYAKVHAGRLRETFERLRKLSVPQTNYLVVELGAASFYQQTLRSMFPRGKFQFVGKPLHGNVENTAEEFVDFNLEEGRWPYADKSVDLFLCFEVLEHLFWDPMAMFAQANRCLKDGGLFVVTTPNIASWRSLKAVLTHYSPYLYMPFFPKIPHWESHRREYTVRDMEEFGRAGGFSSRIETFNSYTTATDSKLLREMLHQHGLDEWNRGDTIYAVYKKETGVVDRYPTWFYKGYFDAYIATGIIKNGED